MKLLIVTPVHNESANIGVLARQLSQSETKPALWVIVDDGSTDDTADIVRDLKPPFPLELVARTNVGGLIGGSAFTAWQFGVDHALENDRFDAVMKLDADVELAPDYLTRVIRVLASEPTVGLAGGVLTEKSHREQVLHVPGPVKLYSWAGYRALDGLARRVGFDVMDELAIKAAGLEVRVLTDTEFRVRRAIGASQGLVHGRKRNGRVCRWTGYWFPYFLLHVVRYLFRKPYVAGSVAMVWGYATAGNGPYDSALRDSHAREQKAKMRGLLNNPVGWVRATYLSAPR